MEPEFKPREKVMILSGVDAGKISRVVGVSEWFADGRRVAAVIVVCGGGARSYRPDQLQRAA